MSVVLQKNCEYFLLEICKPLQCKASEAKISGLKPPDKMNDPTQFEQVDETCEFGGAVLYSESLDMTAFWGIDTP